MCTYLRLSENRQALICLLLMYKHKDVIVHAWKFYWDCLWALVSVMSWFIYFSLFFIGARFSGQLHIPTWLFAPRKRGYKWRWFTMHPLWMQLEFVGCNFTGMERLYQYHSSWRYGDQIASTRRSRTISGLGCTRFAYLVCDSCSTFSVLS